MYKLGQGKKRRYRRFIFWGSLACLLLALIIGTLHFLKSLKPKTNLTQAAAVVKQVSFNAQTKLYTEPDFTISLPQNWTLLPRPVGSYQSYTWQSPDRRTDGQLIEVYEDTIPTNFAVNRVLIVEGGSDQLTIKGQASDNCANFTGSGAAVHAGGGVRAKWQDVDFLCDVNNQERDVIGTSSTDGINTVKLTSPSGRSHQFFFTYTDFAISPDYTVFYNALQSLRMK